MLAASLALSLVALAATLEAPSVPSPPSSAPLAQDDGEPAPPPPLPEGTDDAPPAADDSVGEESVGEDMGAPPPPPPPPPAVTPPAGARVVEPEAEGPRARMRERRKQRQKEADGLDPLLTTAAQIGAGTLTCGVCTLGYCGISAISGIALGVLGISAIPFVGLLVSGALDAFLCGAVGATVGGVETFTGNLLGQEDGSFLWPVLAGAGIGAGVSAVGTGVGLTLAVLNLGTQAPAPGQTPDPNQVLAATNPIALALSLVSLGACVAGCAAIPIVPAIVYSLTAEPKGTSTAALLEPAMPSSPPALTAMAY